MSATEIDRIDGQRSDERSPPVEVLLRISSQTPDAGLARVLEVMRLVARTRMKWETDAWWEQNLPRWFVDACLKHTPDDILKNPELWDFGSWLDAMKDPGWEWWSSALLPKGWIIRVCAHRDTYSIEPLIFLCRCAGAYAVATTEETHD